MSLKYKFINNIQKFARQNEQVMDSAMERMAKDVKQIAKQRVPVKDANLIKEIETDRKGLMQHRVIVNSEYAGYQERGQRRDGTRKVRKYTTAGTGKGYLSKAGQSVSKNALNYLIQAANLIKMRK